MWAEKKIVVEIDENYVDQKKTPNGNVHNRESIRQKISSTKHKNKNCRTLIAKKKRLFSLGGKKKVCKQQKL